MALRKLSGRMSVHTSLTYSRQAFLLLRGKTSRQPLGISRSASHSEYCSSIFTRTTYSRVSSSSMGAPCLNRMSAGCRKDTTLRGGFCRPLQGLDQNPSLEIASSYAHEELRPRQTKNKQQKHKRNKERNPTQPQP